MIGETVSHYRIIARLGAGGMGEVYQAEDTRLRRLVALKVMQQGILQSEEAKARFLREAQAASALNHPNIATIYEIDEFELNGEQHSFIAMEFVQGRSLNDYARTYNLRVAQKLELLEQIADALSEAHNRGIVHRDVKCSNVLVTDSGEHQSLSRGRVKVLDFGLAKRIDLPTPKNETRSEWHTEILQTVPGRVLGTLAYMSPEQALGHDIDHRTDIFSLGVVAYELLTDKLPFQGRTSLAMADAILHAQPPALTQADHEIPLELEQVVFRMLEKDRSRRFASLREVVASFSAIRNSISGNITSSFRGTGVDPYQTSFDPYQTNPSFGAVSVRAARPGTSTIGARTGKSVAVMNFVNITRNPDDEWLGTGIAETVTADLKKIENVTVIGRELMYEVLRHLSADNKSDFDEKFATQVGREVGARYIIGGGYQRIGEMLRLTARVVVVESGEIISTVKLDGRMSELFDLQDRVVFELSRDLNLSLHSGEREVIGQDETSVMEAFEALTKGMMQMRALNREGVEQAITHFERAIELDPKYARAWAHLGLASQLKSQMFQSPEMLETAINSFQKAIELNPHLPDAYSGLGFAFIQMDRISEAIGAIRRALAFAPDNSDALSALARAYMIGQGDFQTAANVLEKSLAGNPKAGWVALQLSYCHAWLGNYERAEEVARKAVELQENLMSGTEGLQIIGAYSRLGYIYYLQGRYEDAITQYYKEIVFLRKTDHGLRERTMIEINQRLVSAYWRQGNLEEAESAWEKLRSGFNRLLEQKQDDPFTRYYMACAAALMGDKDEALAHLDSAVRRRRAYISARAAREIDFESLRQDDRFTALMTD